VDYFHVVRLMNERIGQLWYAEKDVDKRNVIKGTRWILLRNGNDIFDAKYKTRLDNVLNLNEPLMIA
jgi:transposase